MSDQQHQHDATRTLSLGTGQGQFDPLDLPLRQVTNDANMEEYTAETVTGEIIKPVKSSVTGKEEDWKLVTFKVDDPENPKNWSKAYKWYCTMVVSFTCFVVAFASSVITADLEGPSEDFNVSHEVSLVTITVFVIGFGVGKSQRTESLGACPMLTTTGPMMFAPLSEMVGRRPVYAITLLLAVIFVIPCAVSKNIATLIVCRAIDGIAFSAPMTLVGGTLADLWRNEERGVPMAAFSASPFIGPAIGPLVGGYLCHAGWRWLYWIQLILAFVAWVLITFTVPETYAPMILKKRAAKLRKTENDPKYVTEMELDARPMAERLRIFMIRPFQLLFLEPIVLFISIYMSVLYGLLYMFFVA
jgi:multidrug resistance protein